MARRLRGALRAAPLHHRGRTRCFALTGRGDRLDAARAELEDGDLWVTFPSDALRGFVARAGALPVRVFGGFDPDPDHYGYEAFQLKGAVDASDPAVRE